MSNLISPSIAVINEDEVEALAQDPDEREGISSTTAVAKTTASDRYWIRQLEPI